MLCFAVVILTHLPFYETNKDVHVLEQLKNALWFILEPLMVKNENFSLQFYKVLLELMKSNIDASDPPSDNLNHVSQSNNYLFNIYRAVISCSELRSLPTTLFIYLQKMWALCDLSLTIIMSKATSYNDFNKEYPFQPTVPTLYYK